MEIRDQGVKELGVSGIKNSQSLNLQSGIGLLHLARVQIRLSCGLDPLYLDFFEINLA
jgi:hypothetical protein